MPKKQISDEQRLKEIERESDANKETERVQDAMRKQMAGRGFEPHPPHS